jgi:hypothetical protein
MKYDISLLFRCIVTTTTSYLGQPSCHRNYFFINSAMDCEAAPRVIKKKNDKKTFHRTEPIIQLLQVHSAERLDQRRSRPKRTTSAGAALSTGATVAMLPEISADSGNPQGVNGHGDDVKRLMFNRTRALADKKTASGGRAPRTRTCYYPTGHRRAVRVPCCMYTCIDRAGFRRVHGLDRHRGGRNKRSSSPQQQTPCLVRHFRVYAISRRPSTPPEGLEIGLADNK